MMILREAHEFLFRDLGLKAETNPTFLITH